MADWTLKNERKGNEKTFESRSEAEEKKSDMVSLGVDPSDLEIIPPESKTDGAGKTVSGPEGENGAEVVDVEPTEPVDPASLSENPIQFLRDVNTDFVNTIKGTPAISKQGFRFIQREFEITTESEVVQWSEDPLGCVVWARAELNDEYSAEAHGEGWQFESGVSDNEFVRYADSRAKNRAISDLTASGSLAVEELTNNE